MYTNNRIALMMTAGLAVMAFGQSAAAQQRDRIDRVSGQQDLERNDMRQMRSEMRQRSRPDIETPARMADPAPPEVTRNVSVQAASERGGGSRGETQLDRQVDRRPDRWRVERAASDSPRDRPEASTGERSERAERRRDDRSDRLIHRSESRIDRVDNRSDNRIDRIQNRRGHRDDRWRDARRHAERERWRNHYRWPRTIIHPSIGYSYRPHWWGTQYYYFDSRYNHYAYDYGAYYRPGYGYQGAQLGSGWAALYPWLRQDAAGRHWVMWNFDSNRNGRLGNDEARRANREFERLADRNRDGYLSDREISFGVQEMRDEYRYSYRYG